jgi:hypothetical protein
MKGKFKIGDKIQIINYGSLLRVNKQTEPENTLYKKLYPIVEEDEKFFWCDLDSRLIGKTAIVKEVSTTQGIIQYALKGLNKTAWYNEEQLELIV